MGESRVAGTKRERSAPCPGVPSKRQKSVEASSPSPAPRGPHPNSLVLPDSTTTISNDRTCSPPPPGKVEPLTLEQLASASTLSSYIPPAPATAKDDVDAAHCPSIIPCSDPECEDGVPCPESADWCETLECLGEICYDRDCHVEGPEEGCCEEPCPDGHHCQSPCYSLDCDLATCDEPCAESMHGYVPCSEFQQTHVHDSKPAPDCGCIDPRCLETAPHWHCHDPQHFHGDIFDTASSSDYHQSHLPRLLNAEESSKPQRQYDPNEHFYALLHGTTPSYDSTFDAHYPSMEPPATPALTNTSTATPSTCVSQTTCSLPPLFEPDLSCRWVLHSEDAEHRLCGQRFDNAEELHRHVEKAHVEGLTREDVAGNGFFCRWQGCDRFLCRSFQARPKLKRHAQTHTLFKPFVCRQCGVQMKTKDAMEKHERTHTGERPYRCQVAGCASSFATSTELKTHMVVHSGRKPHRCPFCRECFADSSNLSKHKKTHFVGMYRCPECGARMKRWDQMRRHIHTQSHAVFLLRDRRAQLEYKARMEREFRELPDDQKAPVLLGSGSTRAGFAVV